MKRRYLASSLFVGLLLCLFAGEAAAQTFRPEGVYIRGRIGANSYAGDRDQNPDNSFSEFTENQIDFPSFGLDLGYMRRIGFINGGVALSYIGGDYTDLMIEPHPAETSNDPPLSDESSTWRHTLTLDARIGLYPNGRVDPYVQLGLGGTYGKILSTTNDDDDTDFEMSFTPKAALGLDIALTPRVGIFLEAASLGMFPDDNIDLWAGQTDDDDDFDVLAFYGGGLRVNFGTPFTPVEVLALDCPAQLEAGESGTFTATVNEEEATPPIEYQWDFGDGTTGTGLLATKRFSEAGTYTLTFTASNGEETTSSQTCTVEVVEPPQPAVISSISADPNPARVGQQVSFTSSAMGDSPISYSWDFGDGSTGDGANPTHTYEEAGTYTVTLEASNDAGSDTSTLTMEVTPELPAICFEVTEMNSVFFGRNSSTLSAEGREALRENLEILEQCPNIDARVEGFASPSERNPQQLSDDRARAVQQYYQDGGIPLSRINAMGMGAVGGQTSKKGGGSQFRRADTIPVRTDSGAPSGMDTMDDDSDMEDDDMMEEDMEMEEDTTDDGMN